MATRPCRDAMARQDCPRARKVAGWQAQDGSRRTMSARVLLPLAALAGAAVCLTASACGGSGTLAPPTSDSQYDDPDQPSTGSQAGGPGPPVDAGAAPVALPSGEPGIGFDDLRFAGDLSELLVPGGRSGNLDIVDPSSERVTAIGGYSTSPTYTGDASFGAASADEGNSLVYVVDRTTGMLSVVDPTSATIVASTALLSTPGYVRYVAPTQELWVTEPGASQIEIFTLTANGAAAPAHAALLARARRTPSRSRSTSSASAPTPTREAPRWRSTSSPAASPDSGPTVAMPPRASPWTAPTAG